MRAFAIAALTSGRVRSWSEWKMTFEVETVSCGNLSSRASAAFCDSTPGSLKVSSAVPP